MNSKLRDPDGALPATLLDGCGAHSAPRLVICDPASLCALAIGAVVQKRTRWQVACVTTNLDDALAAAAACRAHALLFDVRDCSARTILDVTQRIRSACPQLEPVLLTGHIGVGVLRRAMAAGVNTCVHKSESVAVLAEALYAVEQGSTYLSEAVVQALAARRHPARQELQPIRVNTAMLSARPLILSGYAQSA